LVVEPRKLERLLYSPYPWYIYKRSQLRKNDIGVASVLLNHSQLMFYRGNKDIDTLYRQCRLLYGDILYVPIRTYPGIVMQMKIRAAVYLSQLMGVRMVRYRYNDDRRNTKKAESGVNGPMGTSGEASRTQQEGDGTDNQTVLSYPHVPTSYILCTPREFQSRVISEEYHRGLMMCPKGIFAFHDMQSLLSARLESQVNEVSLSLQEDARSVLDTRVIARVQSMWSGLARYMTSQKKVMTIGMHMQFYSTPSLVSLDALKRHSCFDPRHFTVTVQSNNRALVDAFVTHHLSEPHRLRYNLYKLLCPTDAQNYLESISSFDSIEENMIPFLDTLSFANLIPLDENGLQKARSAAWLIHQSVSSHEEPIDTYPFYKPLISYLLRVYNAKTQQRNETPSFLLLSCSEKSHEFYGICKHIVDNLDDVPDFSVLQSIVDSRLTFTKED
jgi:hypothetical protein